MARLNQYGLRRVLGTSALFSTAYGNVGSSIYYALGLTAGIALGLTPLVFIISGIIFGATPNWPKIPVARSCEMVPTICPGTASLNELLTLGITVTTEASVIGIWEDPRLRKG